ncbi:MAG: PQQ-binding-like beta-propeller repeat protein [Rhodobacteraceae bacterium]|nr:PQQ-binding-like beta-propeller repeat protein [Paracoccaceae bacterium]
MAGLLAALAAGCSGPEVILPGPRYDVRQTDEAAADYAREVQAGTLPQTATRPPTSTPPVPYQVSGTPKPVSLPAPVANAEWTHVNGSPSHSIRPPAFGSGMTQIWAVDAGRAGTRRLRLTADPVVGGGRVFTMSAYSEVQATSPGGAVLWRRSLTPATERPGEASGGGLAYADGRLYVTTGYGELRVLDATSGADIWVQRLAAVPNSAPTVSGGFIYLTTRDNQAWAIDRSNGRILWQIEGGETGAVVIDGAAPAVSARAVMFPFGSGDVIAALRESGVRLWSTIVTGQRLGRAYAEVSDITADPVVVGDTVYVGTPTGRLAALDVNTGERKWTAKEGSNSAVWPAGNAIYLVSDAAEIVRLDAATGETVWSATLPYYTTQRVRSRRGVFAHFGPVLAGGRLIVASTDGYVREIDPASGKLLRATPLGSPAAANPVVAGQTLYVLTEDGRLHAFR